MQVKEKMITDPKTLSPRDSLWDAAEIMTVNHLSAMPVVDATGQLKGVVEIVDLLPSLVPLPFSTDTALRLLDDWVDERNLEGFKGRYRQVTVNEVMHWDLHILKPHDSLLQALRVISRSGARHLYVVGDNYRLLGVITPADILNVMRGER